MTISYANTPLALLTMLEIRNAIHPVHFIVASNASVMYISKLHKADVVTEEGKFLIFFPPNIFSGVLLSTARLGQQSFCLGHFAGRSIT